MVLLTHEEAYLDKLLTQQLSESEQRKIDFPQSPELIERGLVIMQGNIDVAPRALKHVVGLNLAVGTHHTFVDRGEGFCLLNEIAIANNYLLNQKLCQKILIIDLDVYTGNDTTKLFENWTEVFILSMPGAIITCFK